MRGGASMGEAGSKEMAEDNNWEVVVGDWVGWE